MRWVITYLLFNFSISFLCFVTLTSFSCSFFFLYLLSFSISFYFPSDFLLCCLFSSSSLSCHPFTPLFPPSLLPLYFILYFLLSVLSLLCFSPCAPLVVSGVKRHVFFCFQTWVKGDHTRGDVHPARLFSNGEGRSLNTSSNFISILWLNSTPLFDVRRWRVYVFLFFLGKVASLHQPGGGSGPEWSGTGHGIDQLGVVPEVGASDLQNGLVHFL